MADWTASVINMFCRDCSAGIHVPDKGMGRAQGAAWRTRHQGHTVIDSSTIKQPSMADPEPDKPSMDDPEPLVADPERYDEFEIRTGIYVRAQLPDGTWDSVDIIELTKDSLTQWLRSRGGDNPWAESVVRTLLGHGG